MLNRVILFIPQIVFPSVIVLLFLVSSCQQKPDGSNAGYIDNRLHALEDSLLRNGSLNVQDLAFLDSIKPGLQGLGINQLAHKYIVYARKSATQEDKILYTDSAITLLENRFTASEKTAMLLSDAAGLKGGVHLGVASYDEAIRSHTLQKIALAQVKDSCKHTAYYDAMARIHFTQRKFLLAVPYFKTVIQLTAKCRPTHAFTIIQEHLDNIGICYDYVGMNDSAHYYYNAALDFIEQEKDSYDTSAGQTTRIPLMKAVVYGNQGELYLRQKQFRKAEEYLAQSLEITRNKDELFALSGRMQLMKIYIQTNQLDKATLMMNELNAGVDTNRIGRFLIEFYRMRAQYYKFTGDLPTAYNSLLRSTEITDSVVARERNFVGIDIAREFENKEQKSINEALKRDNKLQQSYLLIFIVSTLLACVIAGLIWYNLKRKSLYVSRLKKLNAEVERKNEDLYQTLHSLEESHAENTRLMRAVAHDLRNPVGAIRTLAYSLNKKELAPEIKDALLLIQTTCTDSLNLIKDLLDHKKEGADIPKELVDMGRLIEQCSQILQLKAGEKNQQLTLQIDHPKIPANREKLYRVISNLVNNAIKFSPENSEIKISLQKKENSIVVSVKDHGIGIPSDLKDKILSMAPETSRKGTAGEESYGLGLSICKKIVQEHNGNLWFESEEGKGSVFYMELPMGT